VEIGHTLDSVPGMLLSPKRLIAYVYPLLLQNYGLKPEIFVEYMVDTLILKPYIDAIVCTELILFKKITNLPRVSLR
jgi:hypothetical protein